MNTKLRCGLHGSDLSRAERKLTYQYCIVCKKNQTPIEIRGVFHENTTRNNNLLKYKEKLVKLNLRNIMPLILIRPLEVRGCLAILMVAYPHDGLPAGIEGLGDR